MVMMPTSRSLPSSRKRRAVDVARLLVATDKVAEALQQGPAPGADGLRLYSIQLNRVNAYISSLREYLAELHAVDTLDMPPPKKLQEFGFRVDALERRFLLAQQQLRRRQASAKEAERASPMSRGGSPATLTATTVKSSSSPLPPPELEGASSPPAGSTAMASTMRPQRKGENRRQTPQEIRQAMEKQQATQQLLKMQLEELVSALKESSMMIHSELREQNQLLEKTDDAAAKNLDQLNAELKKTEEQLKRNSSNTWTSCLLIIAILVSFVFTFLVMRLLPKRRWLLY